MNEKNEKIQLLEIEKIASICFIGVVLVSIYITDNEIKKIKNEPYNKYTYNISLNNRIFAIVLLITFLYLSIKNYDIKKETSNDLYFNKLQILASILALTTGLISLYITYNSNQNNIDLENPEF